MTLCPVWKSSLQHVCLQVEGSVSSESTTIASCSTVPASSYLWDISGDLQGRYSFVILPPPPQLYKLTCAGQNTLESVFQDVSFLSFT